MSIAEAERLKRELTDKYVIVANGVPELRRFQGRTGRVKTVNMNCRALVEFGGVEDIAWYDIDPSFLKVVEEPLPKQRAAAAEAGPAPKPAAARPAAAAPAGKKLSPLELARQQGAAGATPAPSATPAAKPAAAPAGKKLSPLERARQQGAAKSDGPAAVADSAAGGPGSAEPSTTESPVAAEPPPPKPAQPGDGKKLSPLELARRQGAAKPSDA